MKIVFFESAPEEKDKFSRALNGHELAFLDEALNVENAAQYSEYEIISTFINSTVNAEVLSKLNSTKLITTRSTGFDHIDTNATKSKGISVGNVPHYGENTVAEHAFALILSLSRNVHKSYIRSLQDNFQIDDLVGFDLKDKTLGVVGTGNIGMHIIRIARGFGMNVIAFSRTQDKFVADIMGYSYVNTFEELAAKSDIVTFHVPLTDQTKHMLNKDNINSLKKGAIIINTARGEIIETEALYEALKNGNIGGAGIDVIEGEKYIREDFELSYANNNPDVIKQIFRDKQIFKMDNVVFTPHNGFNSKEARERIISTTIENIINYSLGKKFNSVY